MSNINGVNSGVKNQSILATTQNTGKERTKKILKGVAIGVGTIALLIGAKQLYKCGIFDRNLKNTSGIKNVAKEVDLKPFKYEARFKELSDIYDKQLKEIMEESSVKVDQYLKEMREKAGKMTEEMYVNIEKDFQKTQKEVVSDIKEFFKF